MKKNSSRDRPADFFTNPLYTKQAPTSTRENTNDVLPHSISGTEFTQVTGTGWVSWQFRILPQMEQTSLFEQFDWTKGQSYAVPNYTLTRETILTMPCYLCPSRALGTEKYFKNRFADTNTSYKYCTPSDYAACLGDYINGSGAGETPQYGYPATGDNGSASSSSYFFYEVRGIIGRNGYAAHFAAITDGLSNTFAVGESIGGLNPHNGFVNESWATTAHPINYQKAELKVLYYTLNGTRDSSHSSTTAYSIIRNQMSDPGASFSSEHSGGANFLLCDGSVKFVSETIDGTVYRATASRYGAESVGL